MPNTASRAVPLDGLLGGKIFCHPNETVNKESLDSDPYLAMLKSMEPNRVGSFLGELRRRQRRSLHHVAKKIGKRGISKQALSLIERGRMRVPRARLALLRQAYRMSIAEERELALLYAFETMVENTGEDREFAEAVLSVIDPKTTSSIYVLGGRKLALTSPILREKASIFLKGEGNTLFFVYPKIDVRSKVSLWHHNTERERIELREAIQALSKESLLGKMRFIEIDTSIAQIPAIAGQILSLCGPFTTTTIAGSNLLAHFAGYIYVEGPRDRWVLLKPDQARRAAIVLESAIEIANVERGPIREHVDR